jgi:Homeodomain-like domain
MTNLTQVKKPTFKNNENLYLAQIMNYKISDDIQRKIVRLWLEGKSRKDIALICHVSEGTVSNVIADWKQTRGEGDADALRELGSNLKRSGIDTAQCAQGHRTSMILRKMGVNEDDFESFISKLYERCMKISGLTEDKIGSYLEDLVEFSDEDDNGGNIPKISEIPQYIEQKKNEKRKLKEDIQNLQKQKKISEEEASYANELRDAAFEIEKTTVTELREYSNFKAELRRCGLSSSIVDDPRKLVRVTYGIKQRGYDVDKVLSEYSDIEFMQVKRDMLSTQVRALEDKIVNLQSQYLFLESQVNLHRQLLHIYDKLNLMGFGLRELNILYNRINEISAEYKIFGYKALVNEFFEFLEQRYNIKLIQKVHKEHQHQKTQLSGSFIYKKTTAFPKTSEEQSDQLTDGNKSDERYGSDDDHLL